MNAGDGRRTKIDTRSGGTGHALAAILLMVFLPVVAVHLAALLAQ
jgi:hypothetical protein